MDFDFDKINNNTEAIEAVNEEEFVEEPDIRAVAIEIPTSYELIDRIKFIEKDGLAYKCVYKEKNKLFSSTFESNISYFTDEDKLKSGDYVKGIREIRFSDFCHELLYIGYIQYLCEKKYEELINYLIQIAIVKATMKFSDNQKLFIVTELVFPEMFDEIHDLLYESDYLTYIFKNKYFSKNTPYILVDGLETDEQIENFIDEVCGCSPTFFFLTPDSGELTDSEIVTWERPNSALDGDFVHVCNNDHDYDETVNSAFPEILYLTNYISSFSKADNIIDELNRFVYSVSNFSDMFLNELNNFESHYKHDWLVSIFKQQLRIINGYINDSNYISDSIDLDVVKQLCSLAKTIEKLSLYKAIYDEDIHLLNRFLSLLTGGSIESYSFETKEYGTVFAIVDRLMYRSEYLDYSVIMDVIEQKYAYYLHYNDQEFLSNKDDLEFSLIDNHFDYQIDKVCRDFMDYSIHYREVGSQVIDDVFHSITRLIVISRNSKFFGQECIKTEYLGNHIYKCKLYDNCEKYFFDYELANLNDFVEYDEETHSISGFNCEKFLDEEANLLVNLVLFDFSFDSFPNCKRIKYFAFEQWEYLRSIRIPKQIEYIDETSFIECGNLESIIVDKDNLYYNSSENCNAIVETKTKKLIRGCKNTIILDGITEIGAYSFSNCKELKEIVIPESVKKIGYVAFSLCISLQDIRLPSNLIEIDEKAFARCGSLKEIVIPESVKKIGEGAFYKCYSLQDVKLSSNLEEIEDCTFAKCYSLKEIVIPESVIEIGKYVFDRCGSLEELTIPSSVNFIADGAFVGTDFSRFFFRGSRERWKEISRDNSGVSLAALVCIETNNK